MIFIQGLKLFHRIIYKVPSSLLADSKWDLCLPLDEARSSGLTVSVAESTLIRFIDKLTGTEYPARQAEEIRSELSRLRYLPPSPANTIKIKKLYQKQDSLLFMPDYINVIMERIGHYRRANKGFKINGVEYKRLLATAGGVKNRTIVYVSARLHPELCRMIANGRNPDVPLVPAKLEAYRSLVCSSSLPVSDPEGVLVVKDCVTSFTDSYILLDDSGEGEPLMKYMLDSPVTLMDSDGCGLISPALSRKWAGEAGLTGTRSGFCIRNSFCKGMVFTFDFVKFAEEVAKTYEIMDIWGQTHDIRHVELILTSSMLKLWSSYESISHYLSCCHSNGYSFSINKICPEKLESTRNMNYQFLQSYDFDDSDLRELLSPTIGEIKDVLGGDSRKSMIFLGKTADTADGFEAIGWDFALALAADGRMAADPFVRSKIYKMIKKRIDDAKIGVIKVEGNYSTVSGDPYSLCQSMFGLEVTGLLKRGCCYSRYWNELHVDKVACFRAPMTCANNIRLLTVSDSDEMNKWYGYMDTVTIFNSWDTAAHALNGLDKDGDSVLTTNNPVILRTTKELPALICVQKQAQKKIVTEDDLIESNINSFGDEIGFITNIITSQFERLSRFPAGSPEHDVLKYRICCGQLYQQNAIDKAKGIISGPLPKEWYSRQANRPADGDAAEDIRRKAFNMSILAGKKPYFMKYIYPQTMKEYNKFMKNVNNNCQREFGIKVTDLAVLPDKTNRQEEFLKYYDERMPVGCGDCTVNRISRIFETEFDKMCTAPAKNTFDYGIMKSNLSYNKKKYTMVNKLYEEYCGRVAEYKCKSASIRIDSNEKGAVREIMKQEFTQKSGKLCTNAEELCNIVLDICYQSSKSKQFAWDICGETIISNLLQKNSCIYSIPAPDPKGDIEYGGRRYSMISLPATKGGNHNGDNTQ